MIRSSFVNCFLFCCRHRSTRSIYQLLYPPRSLLYQFEKFSVVRLVKVLQIVKDKVVDDWMFSTFLLAQTFDLRRIERFDYTWKALSLVVHEMLFSDDFFQVEKLLQFVQFGTRFLYELFAIYEHELFDRKVLQPLFDVLVVQTVAYYGPLGANRPF